MLEPLIQKIIVPILLKAVTLALHGSLKGIKIIGAISQTPSPLPVKDMMHQQDQMQSATTGNKCLRCGARGGVVSKYLPNGVYTTPQQGKELSRAIIENIHKFGMPKQAIMPITWICKVCCRYTCFNCTLVIPGSNPLQFYADTYCSEACRMSDDEHWCESCGKPQTCRTIFNNPNEYNSESWRCLTKGCLKRNLLFSEET